MKNKKDIDDHYLFDVHSYDIDLHSNHIYLFGIEDYDLDTAEPGVEYTMANRFIRNLNILMRKNKNPILISMKTCGGWWEEGMAIYDAIKACPNHVTILCYSPARSMSSIILQAADKRVLMPHTTFMFHDGTMGYEGTVKQFLNESEELVKTTDQMMKIYIDSMKEKGKLNKWSRKRIYDWIRNQINKREDVYLSPEQAVSYGFADEVFDGDWDNLLVF